MHHAHFCGFAFIGATHDKLKIGKGIFIGSIWTEEFQIYVQCIWIFDPESISNVKLTGLERAVIRTCTLIKETAQTCPGYFDKCQSKLGQETLYIKLSYSVILYINLIKNMMTLTPSMIINSSFIFVWN